MKVVMRVAITFVIRAAPLGFFIRAGVISALLRIVIKLDSGIVIRAVLRFIIRISMRVIMRVTITVVIRTIPLGFFIRVVIRIIIKLLRLLLSFILGSSLELYIGLL